jgi:hypothetical protein
MIYVALIGLTLILVRGTIFRSLQRRWPAFFRCSQCVGMWVGLAAGASGVASMGRGRVVDAVLVGTATSVLSLATDAVLLKLLGDPSEET